MRLDRVYWIGRGSGAGKSTVAQRLAAEWGLQLYDTDQVMSDHAARAIRSAAPYLHEFVDMGMDERWVTRSPAEMLETFHWFRGEGLNTVRVVDAAIELADEHGLDELSMPKLARHVGVGTLLASGRLTIPAVFDILEAVFERMSDDGIEIEDAVRTFYAALTYTIGYVLWEIPRSRLQTEVVYEKQWADLISELDPATYPILTGPAAVTPTVASTRQFTWASRR